MLFDLGLGLHLGLEGGVQRPQQRQEPARREQGQDEEGQDAGDPRLAQQQPAGASGLRALLGAASGVRVQSYFFTFGDDF